jgi:O-antigen/teichoic acid export membrane protein
MREAGTRKGVSFAFGGTIVGFFEKAPPEFAADFVHTIWILGVTTGLGFMASLIGAIVTAHEFYLVSSLAATAVLLLRAGLTVVFLVRGAGLVGVAWANLIATAVELSVNYVVCRTAIKGLELRVFHIRWNAMRELMIYGSITMVIFVADTLRTQIDSTVIGKMVGFDGVALYGIVASLYGQIIGFAIAGLAVLTPRFAHLDGKGNDEELKALFIKSLHYSALLGFTICTVALVWGGNFIRLWVGSGFDRSIPILWVLAPVWITDMAQIPSVSIMYAVNKHRYYAVACVAEGVMKLVLTLVLVEKYGIMGAAWATAITMVAIRGIVQPIYMSRIMNLSYESYLKPFLIPLVSSALVVAVSYAVGVFSAFPASNWAVLIFYGAATTVILAAINTGLSRALGLPAVSLEVLSSISASLSAIWNRKGAA